jgi:hypothetical protein
MFRSHSNITAAFLSARQLGSRTHHQKPANRPTSLLANDQETAARRGERMASDERRLPGPNAKLQGTAIAKFARFEWEVDAVDEECAAYQWLEGENIGPKFLGHVAEEGRVICPARDY